MRMVIIYMAQHFHDKKHFSMGGKCNKIVSFNQNIEIIFEKKK